MRAHREILQNTLVGCAPIATGFFLALLACALISVCSCKPTEKVVEVEKWQHDTTTLVDTVHVKDVVTLHDSIYITNTITEHVKDSTLTNVAWKYYTYDTLGNVSSLLDYASTTQHGVTAHTATQSAQTSVNDQAAVHEETSSHSEIQGHTDSLQSKEQEKRGLSKWQKFIQGMGYTFLVVLVLGAAFGGMRLYGKIKKL